MDSFYIITNILKDKDYAVTDKICNYIEQKGKKWTLAKKDEEGHILPGTVPSDVECGLVLGGDGTLIRAIRDLEGEELPLLGINLGTLGYLAEVELKDYQYAIDRLCGEEHAAIELRMMLEGVAGDEKRDLAVNDIVLTREGNIRIVQFNVYVNGTLLNTYLADGVIISTPTGRSCCRTNGKYYRHYSDLLPCVEYKQCSAFGRRCDRGGSLSGKIRQTGGSSLVL